MNQRDGRETGQVFDAGSVDTPTSYPTAAQQFGQRVNWLRTSRDLNLRELEDKTRDLVAARLARLSALPEHAHLTTAELGDLAGKHISKSVIARIENGKPPSIDAAKLLDEALEARGTLEILGAPARAEPYGHLPTGPPYFVGRTADLTQLTALAENHRPTPQAAAVIVIGGLPGIGKSALALRWANHMAANFDIVLFAALGGYAAGEPATHTEILADLLRGLGIAQDHLPASEQQRESLLREQIRRREQRVLVLLDNAKDSSHVQPVLPCLAGTTVLVTSRPQLSGLVLNHGAKTLSLDTLNDVEACELAADIITDDRTREEPDALAQLVDMCGSLPLAVIVAAERIAAEPDTSIREHVTALADLGRRLHLLDIDETAGVRAAFEWSYQTLPPDGARMFSLLSLSPGPWFSIRAAAALAGVTVEKAARLLDELAQAHLLDQINADHYRFHDLLRVYATEQAEQWPVEVTRAAVVRLIVWFHYAANHAAWMLTPMRDHHVRLPPPPPGVTPPEFGSFRRAFSWCTAELASFLPIARLGMDNGLYTEVWRMTVDLFDYFVHSRPGELWITLFRVAIDAATKDGDNARLAEAQEKLAEGHRRHGQLDCAQELNLRAMRNTVRHGPSRTLGFALLGLGNNAHITGDLIEAFELTRRAVTTFVDAGTWLGEAMGRISLGSVYRDLGQRDQAIDHGRRAAEIFAAVGDQHGAAVALLPLARTCLAFGELNQALRHCNDAYSAYGATGDTWGQADTLGVKGKILTQLGEYEAAATCLRSALRLVDGHDEQKSARLLGDLTAVLGAPGLRPRTVSR